MPPDACMYLAIRLSPDWAESGVAHNASAATFSTVLRMVIPPKLRRGTRKLPTGRMVATRLDILDVPHDAVPVEVGLDCAASDRAQPLSQCRVSKQTVESLSHRRGIVRIDQQSRFAVADGVVEGTSSGGAIRLARFVSSLISVSRDDARGVRPLDRHADAPNARRS